MNRSDFSDLNAFIAIADNPHTASMLPLHISASRPRRSATRNSRMGGTVSLPFRKNQAFKFAYSRGAYVTIGADYNSVTVGWQYTWLKR